MHAMVLATALKSTNIYRSSIGALVFHIQDIMQLEFSFCNVSLCTRSCNKVGSYVLDAGSCIYMSEVPSYVMDIVSGDLPLHRA
jgi:hypothetical protein